MKNYIRKMDETVTFDTKNNQYYVTVSSIIPKAKINSYIKRVKEQGGVELNKMLGEYEIVDLIVKYLVDNIDPETLPLNAVYPIDMGDEDVPQGQAQVQGGQAQPNAQVQVPAQPAQGAQAPAVPNEGQAPSVQNDNFESAAGNEDLPQ